MIMIAHYEIGMNLDPMFLLGASEDCVKSFGGVRVFNRVKQELAVEGASRNFDKELRR